MKTTSKGNAIAISKTWRIVSDNTNNYCLQHRRKHSKTGRFYWSTGGYYRSVADALDGYIDRSPHLKSGPLVKRLAETIAEARAVSDSLREAMQI